MKVLDLSCANAHHFEGWFASEDEFQSQLTRGLVSCPLCGDAQVVKKLSAPRLNLSAAAPAEDSPAMDATQMQAAWMNMVRHVMSNTEDVGDKFSQEARKMHYGETEHRNIRGQATAQETQELLEEGVAVLPLPVPDALKEPLQ
jgi:hypothetical protein